MSARTLYSYNADTGRAQVYSRRTGAVIFDAEGVDMRLSQLIGGLADEMYQEGVEAGRAEVLADMDSLIERRRG